MAQNWSIVTCAIVAIPTQLQVNGYILAVGPFAYPRPSFLPYEHHDNWKICNKP